MLQPVDVLAQSRREVRRAVSLECEVISDYWDDPVKLKASDLSPNGVWLETPLTLDAGTRVLVSLTPPRTEAALFVAGKVRHSELRRRRSDVGQPGMGIEFDDITFCEREIIDRSLEGLPPPLPRQNDSRAHGSDTIWIEADSEEWAVDVDKELDVWIECLSEPLG